MPHHPGHPWSFSALGLQEVPQEAGGAGGWVEISWLVCGLLLSAPGHTQPFPQWSFGGVQSTYSATSMAIIALGCYTFWK